MAFLALVFGCAEGVPLVAGLHNWRIVACYLGLAVGWTAGSTVTIRI